MEKGTVAKLISERGFGFLKAEDGSEVFFHRTGLDSSLDFDRLQVGDPVEFQLEKNPKGPRAVRIKTPTTV